MSLYDVAFLTAGLLNIVGLTAGTVVLLRHRSRLYNGAGTRYVARRLERSPRDLRRSLTKWTARCWLVALVAMLTLDLPDVVPLAILAVGFAIPDLDDYLTGDDRWKRRWHAAKNRIKWRMTMPAPMRPSSGTA